MKPYGLANKSKMNFHPSQKCGCELCNSWGRSMSKKRERQEWKKEFGKFEIIPVEQILKERSNAYEYMF